MDQIKQITAKANRTLTRPKIEIIANKKNKNTANPVMACMKNLVHPQIFLITAGASPATAASGSK